MCTLCAHFSPSAHAGSLMALCANIVCLLSVLLQPYMPQTSTDIQQQLNVSVCVCVCVCVCAVVYPGGALGARGPSTQLPPHVGA